MNFMTLFIGIPFLIVLIYFIISLRNNVFVELELWHKAAIVLMSLVPIWGIIISLGATVYFINDVRNANSENRIFRPSWINILLFGKDKCYNKKGL